MEALNNLLGTIVENVWGLPLVILLVGTGLSLSVILGGIQFRGFVHAIRVIRGEYDDPEDKGELSHFEALTTALSATVGLGNIAGVAVAIHIGGPGATFWMVVTGLIGMATKYAECSLGVMFRKVDEKGTVHGGAMYYIEQGLGKRWKPLAMFFAFAAFCASFGAGNMFQSNQVAAILYQNFGFPKLLTGILLAVCTGAVIIGGIRRIGHVTSRLVPFMGAIYVLGALTVIIANYTAIPSLIYTIIHDAFTGTAIAGGATGIALREVLVQGVRRACFSNEAGLGSAPIAHSATKTNEPIREGVVALLEPFIDTVVICTLTALVILISGAWNQEANGVELTAMAFDFGIPGFGYYFLPIAVTLFAYSTMLSWSYYGERAFGYMTNQKGIIIYKVVFCLLAIAGSTWNLIPVLSFSDIMLALMAIPNLIAVMLLLPTLKRETEKYFNKLNTGQFKRHPGGLKRMMRN